MGIYRNVSTAFWEDRKVVEEFTPEDKYFYLYLFTNPHTTLTGCYELGYRQASIETGYNKETIERLMNRFQNEHKVIIYDEETKEILLLNWYKHNWTKSEKCFKGIVSQMENIKSQQMKEYINTVCIPYIYPMHTVLSTENTLSDQERYPINRNSNSNRNRISNRNSNSDQPWSLIIGDNTYD